MTGPSFECLCAFAFTCDTGCCGMMHVQLFVCVCVPTLILPLTQPHLLRQAGFARPYAYSRYCWDDGGNTCWCCCCHLHHLTAWVGLSCWCDVCDGVINQQQASAPTWGLLYVVVCGLPLAAGLRRGCRSGVGVGLGSIIKLLPESPRLLSAACND